MKFSYKLSSTIFATGLTTLIFLSVAMYKINYNSVIKLQTKVTESIVNEISDDIDYMLSEKIKIALTLANSNTIIQALEESIASDAELPDEKRKDSIKQLNEKWKSTQHPSDNFILEFTDNKAAQFLKSQQTLLKDEYGEIFLTNKFGALVASTSKLSTFSHGHKYWWLASFNNGKGKVFFDDRGYDDSVGGYVLGLVVPIKKGTQVIGILKCNLNILGSISEVIPGAQDILIGKFKLTRSGGMVVFEEGFEPLSTQIHDNIFKQLNDNDQGSIIINDSKEKYLVGFSQIKLTKDEIKYSFGGTFESIDHKKGNKGESWYVLYYRQMSIIQTQIIESMKSVVLMGITILVVLLFVSYFFGRKIAQPLTILDKATKKIGKGDFEYKIDISQNDEFGNLAHSFKVMSANLQKTTTSIELFENEINERKQAEEKLKQSGKKLSRMFNFADYMVCIGDLKKGHFTKISPAFTRHLGWSEKEMLSKPILDFIHPADVKKTTNIIKEQMEKAVDVIQFENRYKTKKGDFRWFEWSANPVPEEGITYSAAYDITDRKLAEKDLKWELTVTKAMSELSIKLISPVMEITDIMRLTQDYAQMLTDSQDGYCGFIEEETKDLICQNLTEMMGKDCFVESEDQRIRFLIGSDGLYPKLWGHALNSLEPFFTNDPSNHSMSKGVPKGHVKLKNFLTAPALHLGKLVGQISIANSARNYTSRDLEVVARLTDLFAIALGRKLSEKALRESEQQFKHVLQNSINTIYSFNLTTGTYDYLSPSVKTIYGYTPEEMISGGLKTTIESFHPEDRAKIDTHLQRLLDKKLKNFSPTITYRFKHPKLGYRWILDTRSVVYDANNNPISLIGNSVDITEKKQAEVALRESEKRLQQSQKMESIGNLAGGIAHDFNNLLFPIIGMSEMLLEDLPEDSLEYENAQEIFTAGRRAGDLVQQILAFSRQSEHNITPVRIQNVLKEVLKLSRSTIPTNIKIQQNIQQSCGLVMADSTQIHQVSMNLITNAFHAIEDKNGFINIELKEITLKNNELPDSVLQPGQYIRLSVSDNGIGMSQNTIHNIFEPYFTTKKQGKGTGLGLAVVFGIVKEYGGDIKVYSEVGKGTTFNIYLPLMEKSSDRIIVDKISKAASGTENILLVDDEVSVANLEGQMLSRLGYHLTVETNSEDALRAFRSNPDFYDLVISDMTMPNMTGDQLAKELLSIKADIPIIICTGFSERINKEQAEAIGVNGFLMKPVIKSEMAKMVRKVLDETKNI